MNEGSNKKVLKNVQRILVVRYRFIGDTILTVPFLRNLRQAFPEAVIDVLVGPQSGAVLENCPYVNELIEFDTTRFHKYDSGKGKAKSFLSYLLMLRKRKYDAVFLLKRSLSSGILAIVSGARYRVGYATEGRNLLLTHPVKWRKDIHEVESLFDVLAAAGITVTNKELESWSTDAENSAVRMKVPEVLHDGLKILVHAPAAHPDKMYPLEKWEQVLSELNSKLSDANPLFFFSGAERDASLNDNLIAKSGVRGVNPAGKLSLRESMALYREMDLAVCVDSGPAHLCAAAGTPTVAIFGPTDPERWRPYGDKHIAVFDRSIHCGACANRKTLTTHDCLIQLEPTKIIDAVMHSYKRYVIAPK